MPSVGAGSPEQVSLRGVRLVPRWQVVLGSVRRQVLPTRRPATRDNRGGIMTDDHTEALAILAIITQAMTDPDEPIPYEVVEE